MKGVKSITPVATFRSPFPSKFGIPRQSGVVEELEGRIVFTPEFARTDAIRGLEGFDYLWLIWGFSGNEGRWNMTVRPPRLGGNKSVGVFASRSPFRPNGLGLSSARIIRIDPDGSDGPEIIVAGADLMDGTPIYDVKPYVAYSDAHAEARSGFTDENEWREAEVDFPERLVSKFLTLGTKKAGNGRSDTRAGGGAHTESGEKALTALRKTLAQKPIPQYHHDPEHIYGMPFMGCDVRFRVCGNIVAVTDIVPLGTQPNGSDVGSRQKPNAGMTVPENEAVTSDTNPTGTELSK